MELEQINIKPLEKNIKEIDKLFGKLRNKVDADVLLSLEYEIYYFFNAVSELDRVYIRNLYKINNIKDEAFLKERKNMNSDLATTKKVNKDFISENTTIQLQEMVMERLVKKQKIFTRLADKLDSHRIGELAMQKRQP